MTGTWGAPILPSGIDDFTRKQQPNPAPVDDLSRFVLTRIREAETEPRADGIPQDYYKHVMAHRYAAGMRADMVAFRRIVAEYVKAIDAYNNPGHSSERAEALAQARSIYRAVVAIAMRWEKHHDFDPAWRLE